MPKTAIARRLGMRRTTVIRLLELIEPPRYVRRRQGSQLDPFADEIAVMLAAEQIGRVGDLSTGLVGTIVLRPAGRSSYGMATPRGAC